MARGIDQEGAEGLQLMVGNVLISKGRQEGIDGTREKKSADQFHQLEDVEAHAHCFDSVRLRSATAWGTRLCDVDHGVDCAVAHGCTVALECLADDNEQAGGVEEIVLQLLLDEVGVEDGPEVGSLCSMAFDLGLKRGWVGICV